MTPRHRRRSSAPPVPFAAYNAPRDELAAAVEELLGSLRRPDTVEIDDA